MIKFGIRFRPAIRRLSTSHLPVSGVDQVEKNFPDDKDGYDVEEFDIVPRKNRYYYDKEITKYAKKGKIGLDRALKLFNDMKIRDRITPTSRDFTPLIYGCAKAGYTKKAFDLYKESLKYMDKPTQAMITCLINSCAESPFPEYGLKKLNWFRDHLKFEYNYEFNEIQYRSMIKAYGKCGDLGKAIQVVKEMIENDILPDVNTFNMLLIGCASDKDSGTILALRIFKRMRQFNVKPDLTTFRLFLRCVRDCGIGSKELLKKTIEELPNIINFEQKIKRRILSCANRKIDTFAWLPLISNISESLAEAIDKRKPSNQVEQSDIKLLTSNENQVMDLSKEIAGYRQKARSLRPPNLLLDNHIEEMNHIQAIQLDAMNRPSNRLLLFGGLHGFLETMRRAGAKPDEKTFSLLINCLKHGEKYELEYFRLAKDNNIHRDRLFYDLLIKHICYKPDDAGRLERALSLLDRMQEDGIRPHISTFEALTHGCDCWKMAKKLIDDVERIGMVISDVMVRGFFEIALMKEDVAYLEKLVRYAKDIGYKPAKNLVENLEDFRLSHLDSESFSKTLGNWLKRVEIYEEEHPWKQFYNEIPAKSAGFRAFVEDFKRLERLKQKSQLS